MFVSYCTRNGSSLAHVCGCSKRRYERVSLTRRQRTASICVQLIYKLRCCHCVWKRRKKLSSLHKRQRKRLLVRFQLRLPVADAYLYPLCDLLRVPQKVGEANRYRSSRKIAKPGLVHSVNEIARLLKFNRQEESRRNVDQSDLTALRIRARSYLVHPKGQAGGVRLAIKKIGVMLSYEKGYIVKWIQSTLLCVVIGNVNGDG